MADELQSRQRQQEDALEELKRDQQLLEELAASPLASQADRLNQEITKLLDQALPGEDDTKLADIARSRKG